MSDNPKPNHLHEEDCISVALTHDKLNPLTIMASVKSPKAGAIVLFAGNSPPIPHPTSKRSKKATRHHPRQLRQQARHTSRIHLLPAARAPNNAFNRTQRARKALPDSHQHDPPAGCRSHRRGKHTDCCVCATSAGGVEGRGRGVGGVQGEG